MRPILAIDPGSKTGWAVGDAENYLGSGTWCIAPAKGNPAGARYNKLDAFITAAHYTFGFVKLVYEDSFQRSRIATKYFFGAVTRMESWCELRSIPLGFVNAMKLKKWATGNGHADKKTMMDLGARRFNRPLADDNEIDALWLLEYAKSGELLIWNGEHHDDL